jgi:signal transduction histidine kinase
MLHVFVLIAVAITIGVSSYFLLNDTVNEFEKRLLLQHAERVVPFVQNQAGRWLVRLPDDVTQIFSLGYGGYALAVTDQSGRVVYSSLRDNSSLVRPPYELPGMGFLEQPHGRAVYYIALVPVRSGRDTAWVQVGQDLSDPEVIVDDVARLFLVRLAWPFIILIPLLIVIDFLIVRRLWAPVLAASTVASTIGPSNLLIRLPTPRLPNEVFPLAVAVNNALDRLERALQIQREFTADAAHELRTPLTILRARVDTETDGMVRSELRADIDAMTHIIGQLLELAELEALPETRQASVDLNALSAETIMAMAPLAVAADKSIAAQAAAEPNIVIGNGPMLSRAIKNLLENAIRHSPIGSEVLVSTETAGRIDVLDRGPGIHGHDWGHAFQRFWRKDRQEQGHAGLGLAIVARIVALHGGEVKVSERPNGGAIFSIVLGARNNDAIGTN